MPSSDLTSLLELPVATKMPAPYDIVSKMSPSSITLSYHVIPSKLYATLLSNPNATKRPLPYVTFHVLAVTADAVVVHVAPLSAEYATLPLSLTIINLLLP